MGENAPLRRIGPVDTLAEGIEMALLAVGALAPDINGKTGSGADFRLSDQLTSTRVMLVFYPKDFTPGCTTQLVHVQQSLSEMQAAGVQPFGVNPGDAVSHRDFCGAYDLEFQLVVDEGMHAAHAYGAVRSDGGVLRSVFVIGKDGAIQFAGEGAPSWAEVAAAIPAE